jgi:hypothetical protein
VDTSRARFATRVICDDIRHEAGNKISIMGLYSEKVLVQAFPAVLPKLCAFATICSPRERPILKLVMRVFRNETMLIELPAPQAVLKATNDAANTDDVPRQYVTIHGMANITPMPLEQECLLHVQIETEEGMIDLDPMPVGLADPPGA